MTALAKNPHAVVREQEMPDSREFVGRDERGCHRCAVTLELVQGLISEIRMILNPHKLTL